MKNPQKSQAEVKLKFTARVLFYGNLQEQNEQCPDLSYAR